MKTLWTFLAMTSLAAGSALAQDAVAVDPQHYSVVFENDEVRVLRIRYGPNEESVMHSHPEGVAVFLSDGRGQFTMPDGQVVEVPLTAGEVVWMEETTHQPKNLTDQPFEVIEIELKDDDAGDDD